MSKKQENRKKDTKTIYVRDVPKEIWTSAKVGAAKRGITMREWIIEAVVEKSEAEDGKS